LQKKVGRGNQKVNVSFSLVLRGVLEKVMCRTWFFDGENVVNCMVNVVAWQPYFDRRKMRHVFKIFFGRISN
jgi:hypothetical protein